jgi:hypothetical protein
LILGIGAGDQVQQNPGVIVAVFCLMPQIGEHPLGEGSHG